MMESVYWKTELFPAADAIEARQRCLRWTEKQAVMLERDIMIAMFCVRSLIERHKITQLLAKKPILVVAYPIHKGKRVHLFNQCDINELYDMEHPVERQLGLAFLSNQIIHSYIIFPKKNLEKKRFTHLLVCSDFERNNQLFEVSIEDLIAVMREVGMNYPTEIHFKYDKEKRDYRPII